MNRTYKKPTEETIIINGDVYVKEPDKDFLFVAIYVNRFKQRRVTVEWSEFYRTWWIELIGRFLHTDDLKIPIWTDEKYIPTYFNAEQNAGLDRILTETLLQTGK